MLLSPFSPWAVLTQIQNTDKIFSCLVDISQISCEKRKPLINGQVMEDTARDNLMVIIRAYRDATGKSMTAISRDFYGQSPYFDELRRGERTITLTKLDELVDKFKANWPEGVAWPVLRPMFLGRK